MPKRPCPFEDDLLPQLKTHVGQKQVDNGVSRNERMKEVYDKTLVLLKEGVKTLSKKLNTSTDLDADVPLPKVPSPCKSKPERNLKQTVLNNKLGLEVADESGKGNQLKYDLCGCSRVIDKNMLTKCFYCDQILCMLCLCECIGCSELYCQNCSLPVYDRDEQNMCLNCYQYK